jgi:tetratricopeptide (TPR) repeat protein
MLGFYAWTARPDVRQMYDISDPADAYYNQLVRGFRNGQLNLKREVPPGLVKLADPYDSVANAPYRDFGLHDTSYYKGRLYLYFGVTPAIVLFWPYAVLTGHYLFHRQAVAIFCGVGFLASVALLCALWRRYFSEVGGAVLAACALTLGLVTCVPVMLQRPDVWEVPISCAYAMVMLALLGIWYALHDPARQCRWLAAASLAYGLAVGARPTVLFGAVILLAPVVHAWTPVPGHDGRRWFIAARLLAAAVVPLSLIGFGLLLYNYLRFDNPFEFGLHYQLVDNRQRTMAHMLSPNYFWFNFRVYFLQPIHWGGSFPFAEGIKVPPAPAGQLGVEGPFGVLSNIPFVWMAVAVPLAWRGRMLAERSALCWLISAVMVLGGVSALTIFLYPGACARYQVDFVPALVILAVCGVFGLERALAAKPRWRTLARWVWITALVFSVTVSLLVSVQRYAEERFYAGRDQLGMGRLKEAMVCFEQALRIRPDYAEAHFSLGNVYIQSGRLSDAMAQYEAALRLNPDFAKAHNNLGTILLNIPGRLPDAIVQFQAAVRINPDYANAHYNLGNALLDMPGRLPDAIVQYEAALRINPGYADAHNNLGTVLLDMPGRLSDAIAQFQAALRINPDYADAHNNLGKALLNVPGRLPDAIAEFQAALQINPDSVEAHYNLGNALLKIPGHLPDAIAQFQAVLRLQPDLTPAREILDRLQNPNGLKGASPMDSLLRPK